jgi:hypothetical protein
MVKVLSLPPYYSRFKSHPNHFFLLFCFFLSDLNKNSCVNGTQTLFELSNTGFVWIVTQESLECNDHLLNGKKTQAMIKCKRIRVGWLLMCRNCDLMVTWWYILLRLETLVWLRTIVILFVFRPIIFEGVSILLSVDCSIMLVLTSKRLVQSLIVTYFLYCDNIYSHASSGVNRQLNFAFNSCARYTYDVSQFQSISSHSCSILGVSLNDFYDLCMNMMTYRLLQKRSPSYLFDRFQRTRPTRTQHIGRLRSLFFNKISSVLTKLK